jgi:hypothetical protein
MIDEARSSGLLRVPSPIHGGLAIAHPPTLPGVIGLCTHSGRCRFASRQLQRCDSRGCHIRANSARRADSAANPTRPLRSSIT